MILATATASSAIEFPVLHLCFVRDIPKLTNHFNEGLSLQYKIMLKPKTASMTSIDRSIDFVFGNSPNNGSTPERISCISRPYGRNAVECLATSNLSRSAIEQLNRVLEVTKIGREIRKPKLTDLFHYQN